uniref:Ubiquitinyl hydrolase 1 n=1 Tax=Panagrolaimus sp. ES5 TaxID=591445 RepID=A0AC34FLZ0_9BILA
MGASSSTVSYATLKNHRPNDLLCYSEGNIIYSVWGTRKTLNYDEFCTLFFSQQKVDENLKKRLWEVFTDGKGTVDITQFSRNILFLRHGDRACLEKLLGDALPPEIDLSTIHWLKKDTIFDSFEEVITAVTHFSESDVTAINHFLTRSNRPEVLPFQEFVSMISIPCSDTVKEGLFKVFNVYNRPALAFTEYVSGLSSITRGPETERLRTFCRIWDGKKKGYLDLNDIKQIYADLQLSEAERTLHQHFQEKVTYEEFVIWVLSCPSVNNMLLKLMFMIGCVCLGAPIDDNSSAATFVNSFIIDCEPSHFDEWIILSMGQYRSIIDALKDSKKFNGRSGEKLFSYLPLFKEFNQKLQHCFDKNLILKKDFFAMPTFVFDAVCWWLKIDEHLGLPIRSSCHIKGLPGEWPDDWYHPKPTSNHFFDIYTPYAAFLILDHTKIVDGKYVQRFNRIIPIERLIPIYDVVHGLIEKDINQSHFRIRVLSVDETPHDELITSKSTIADYKCWKTIIFLIEERPEGWTEWPSHQSVGVSQVPKINNNNTKRKIPGVTGLINMRRTCYLNCALQMIAGIKSMEFLRSNEFGNLISAATESNINLTLELSRVYGALVNHEVPFAPKEFKDIFLQKSGFQDNTDNDCHEALESILNIVHDECHPYFHKEESNIHDKRGQTPQEQGEVAWAKYRNEGISFISNGFEGQMRSDLRCSSCGNVSYSFEPFKSFNLSLQDHDITVKVVISNLSQTVFVEKALHLSHDFKLDALFVRVANTIGVSSQNLFILVPNASAEQQKTVMDNPEDHLLRNVIAMNDNDALIFYQLPLPFKHLSDDICIARQRLIRDCRTGLVDRIHRYSIMDAGVPFVFKYEIGLTGHVLYKLVNNYFNLIKDECTLDKQFSMLNRALYESEKTEEYPFYLVYSDPTGLHCPNCHWTLYCIGCEIPATSDLISYKNAKFISVQWKFMPYFLKWSGILHHSRIIDPSAQKLYYQNASHRKISITECLSNAVLPETLDTKLACENCKVKCYFDKTIAFTRLPETFIINLKRFMCINGVFVKNKSSVKFPLKDFDMSPYMVDGICDTLYECIGYVIHRGEIHGGHYVCYTKRNNEWYFLNDEDVSKVDEKDIDQDDAYMIVFQRKKSAEIFVEQVLRDIEQGEISMEINSSFDHVVPTDDCDDNVHNF